LRIENEFSKQTDHFPTYPCMRVITYDDFCFGHQKFGITIDVGLREDIGDDADEKVEEDDDNDDNKGSKEHHREDDL